MEIKILQVFYDKNGLPYKDKERQVHFPIVGNAFQGASNTTKIRFYYDELDMDNETTFVAVSKLPNGKIGSKILENFLDEELNENYALLELDSFYTQANGDLFISLQGYQGGVRVEQDEQDIYQIYGTPTIQATGSIKLSINYATQFIGSGEEENVTLQRIFAYLGTKLGIRATTELVSELPTVGQTDVFYAIYNDPQDANKLNIYVWNETTQEYVWVGDNTLDLGDYYTKEQGEQFEQEIEDRVSDVEDEVASISSGAPSGVYSTVADLTSADPDHSKIYLVTADGKWYYYNTSTSSWTAGGTYQSTGIAFGSVDIPELNRNIGDNFESINMFDKSKVVDGYYFNSDGTLGSNPSSQYCEQYIPVKYGITYKLKYLNVEIYPIATYDKYGNFIARQNVNASTVTFNSNVAYIRISTYQFSFANDFMFCELDKYPSSYQDYNLLISKNSLSQITDENFDSSSDNPLQNKTITNYLFNSVKNNPVDEIPNITNSLLSYGSLYGSQTIEMVSNAGLDSYYFVADRNMEIYVEDEIPSGKYYSICVGRQYYQTDVIDGRTFLDCTGTTARYRNSDNNLPTSSNKLMINNGDIVVFTFTAGTIFNIAGVYEKLEPKKAKENYTYLKTSNQLTINTPKAKYIFKLVQDNSIRLNTWRLWGGYLKRENGTLFAMWENSDAEGVLRLDYEDDYIGGYHGDETMTAIKIYADGTDITSESNKSGYFDNISIYVDSDVYHCDTSATPNVVAFKRSKQLNFVKDKVIISHNWIAQEQVSIMKAPLSLFQCYWKENGNEVAESYSTKPCYKLYTMQQSYDGTYPADTELMTEFYLETNIHPVHVKVLDCNGNSKLGFVAYQYVSEQNRIKFYYENIHNAYTTLNQGDNLYSQFEFEIK